MERTLRSWFAASLGITVLVGALALFTEDEPGAPFALHAVYPLQPIPASLRAAGKADSEGAR